MGDVSRWFSYQYVRRTGHTHSPVLSGVEGWTRHACPQAPQWMTRRLDESPKPTGESHHYGCTLGYGGVAVALGVVGGPVFRLRADTRKSLIVRYFINQKNGLRIHKKRSQRHSGAT